MLKDAFREVADPVIVAAVGEERSVSGHRVNKSSICDLAPSRREDATAAKRGAEGERSLMRRARAYPHMDSTSNKPEMTVGRVRSSRAARR